MITTYGATSGGDEDSVPTAKQVDESEKIGALKRLVAKRSELDPERRALVESMAEHYKIELPPVSGFTQQPNKRREQMGELGEMARVSALPMIGQAGGAILGTAIGGPPGSVIGQSIGGVAGLAANKALGISSPTSEDAALTGAAPVGGKLLTLLSRKSIPGVGAAEQQLGAEAIREMPKMLPGDAASTKAAYDQVAAMGSPTMPVTNLKNMVDSLANVESVAKKYGGSNPTIRRAVLEAGKTLQANGGNMPFQDVAIMLKRYREKVSGLENAGGEAFGAYKALRKSLFDDMAAAEQQRTAAGQNATALRNAMKEAKQSIAKEEFTEMLEQHGTRTVTVSGQTFEVIEPTKMLNKLKAIDFEGSVGAQQYAKIEATLKDLAKIPRPDTGGGAGIGTFKRVVAMGAAAGLGATHGPAGAFGASMAAAGGIAAYDAAASLMMSDKGRNFLVRFFKANQGRMGERTSQLLQFAADQFQDTQE